MLADPKLQAPLAELGGEAMPMTATEFGKLVAAETEKWGKVVKFAGVKADFATTLPPRSSPRAALRSCHQRAWNADRCVLMSIAVHERLLDKRWTPKLMNVVSI